MEPSEYWEICTELSMLDGQKVIVPVNAYTTKENAVNAAKSLAEQLKKLFPTNDDSSDTLLGALGIDDVHVGLRQMWAQSGMVQIGGILLPGRG